MINCAKNQTPSYNEDSELEFIHSWIDSRLLNFILHPPHHLTGLALAQRETNGMQMRGVNSFIPPHTMDSLLILFKVKLLTSFLHVDVFPNDSCE